MDLVDILRVYQIRVMFFEDAGLGGIVMMDLT